MECSLIESRLFGVVAPTIGWAPPVRFLLRRARILELLRRLAPGSLIEVGCGAGALLHELARGHRRTFGLETSEQARGIAKSIAEAGHGNQVILSEAQPGWECSHDLVCAFDVLEHIEDDNEAISLWSNWLKPGGHLCVSVPAHRKRWGAGDEWAGHWRRYDRPEIECILQKHGLIIEHLECYGFPLANLTEWWGDRFYRQLLEQRNTYSRAEATASSGIDRSAYLRAFAKMNSLPGKMILKVALVLQVVTRRTNWGSGYLVLARKP